jgi:hypothetical protein
MPETIKPDFSYELADRIGRSLGELSEHVDDALDVHLRNHAQAVRP